MYRQITPPPDGPLIDELRIREVFTREMHKLLAGMLVPVSAMAMIAETVAELDKDEDVDTETSLFPIMEGVQPVALLWKHACEGHDEVDHRHESQWYLVPLLSPMIDNEAVTDFNEISQIGMEFVQALVSNQMRWAAYTERYGAMP
jgi:hypothetical protein